MTQDYVWIEAGMLVEPHRATSLVASGLSESHRAALEARNSNGC